MLNGFVVAIGEAAAQRQFSNCIINRFYCI